MHLSTDFSTILDQILLVPLYPGIESVQGIVFDKTRGTLWFADLTNKKIRHISTAGVPQAGDIALTYTPNGLARDDADDALWINTSDTDPAPDVIEKRACSTGALIASMSISLTDHDHLFYDDDLRKLLYSFGANGATGKVNVYNAPGSTLTFSGVMALPGADAIEGIVMHAGTLTEMNDGYYHSGNPALNRVLIYSTNYPV